MNNNHFIIPYAGNKRDEVHILYNRIKDKIENIEYIIEPFCGSCAMSYYISLQHPNKYKYILNDNNIFLVKLLKIMKDNNKYIKFVKKINKKLKLINNKFDYITHTQPNTFEGWFIGNKWYCIRPYLYPINRKINNVKENYPIINFLRTENIVIKSVDGCNIYNKYKNNSKSLILLDPPYLESNNTFYKNPTLSIYKNLEDDKNKVISAKICLMLNDNDVVKDIFDNYNLIQYVKQYHTRKKRVLHLLLDNFEKNKI